ncbi:MAG: hypothetical protein ABSB49_18030, partial [Polyangia bacterium]
MTTQSIGGSTKLHAQLASSHTSAREPPSADGTTSASGATAGQVSGGVLTWASVPASGAALVVVVVVDVSAPVLGSPGIVMEASQPTAVNRAKQMVVGRIVVTVLSES